MGATENRLKPGCQPDYPCIQILTVQELLDGAKLKMPPSSITFKQAEKMEKPADPQIGFKF